MKNTKILALAEIEASKRAGTTIERAPLSQPMLIQLADYLVTIGSHKADDLQGTLRFIRRHRLPKAKMLSWLASNGIDSDSELFKVIYAPIAREYLMYLAQNDDLPLGEVPE